MLIITMFYTKKIEFMSTNTINYSFMSTIIVEKQ